MGAGVSSSSGGPAADMYERLVKAVLGRDKDASARPGAQETAERLLRVLQAQAQNLKVQKVDARIVPLLFALIFVRCNGSRECTDELENVMLLVWVVDCGSVKVVVLVGQPLLSLPCSLHVIHTALKEVFSSAPLRLSCACTRTGSLPCPAMKPEPPVTDHTNLNPLNPARPRPTSDSRNFVCETHNNACRGSKVSFGSYRVAGNEQDSTSGVREHSDGHALHVPDGTVPGEGGERLPRAGLEGVHHSAAVQRLHPLRQVLLSGASFVHELCVRATNAFCRCCSCCMLARVWA